MPSMYLKLPAGLRLHLVPTLALVLFPGLLVALGVACGDGDGARPSGEVVEGSRLVLSTAGVDAALSRSSVPSSGEMPSPVGNEVLLYDWSSHPGYGGAPGAGNTVVGGSRATVFKSLDAIKPGDVIGLSWEGRDLSYSVSSVCFWDSRRGNFDPVVAHTPEETLTLLTSYGPAENVELGRLVVAAKPRTLIIVSSECAAGLQPLTAIDFVPAR